MLSVIYMNCIHTHENALIVCTSFIGILEQFDFVNITVRDSNICLNFSFRPYFLGIIWQQGVVSVVPVILFTFIKRQ